MDTRNPGAGYQPDLENRVTPGQPRAEHSPAVHPHEHEDDQRSAPRQGQEFIREAREAASEGAEQARAQIGAATRWLREETSTFVESQRKRFAEKLAHFAQAMDKAAEKLNEDGDANLASLTRSVGQQADAAAGYLRERESKTIVRDAENYTRRRSELVLGGMFVAGLVLSRFLKSSAHDDGGRMAEEDVFSETESGQQELYAGAPTGAATGYGRTDPVGSPGAADVGRGHTVGGRSDSGVGRTSTPPQR